MRLFLLLILLPFAGAVELSGNVYDDSLAPLSNVILTVDTEPKQQYISKNGAYTFNIPQGVYTLTASYQEGSANYYAEEKIRIANEGAFVYDIILFPNLSEEEALSDDFELDVTALDDDRSNKWLWVSLISFLLFAGILYYVLKKRKNPGEDVVYAMVLALIKKHKRVTQKEIRKQVPMSEAKISLVITELEDKGLIKKIKKGRGNIIILK